MLFAVESWPGIQGTPERDACLGDGDKGEFVVVRFGGRILRCASRFLIPALEHDKGFPEGDLLLPLEQSTEETPEELEMQRDAHGFWWSAGPSPGK